MSLNLSMFKISPQNLRLLIYPVATKLMKRWIVMTTRFEWEVSRRSIRKPGVKPRETALQKLLQNFKCFLMLKYAGICSELEFILIFVCVIFHLATIPFTNNRTI